MKINAAQALAKLNVESVELLDYCSAGSPRAYDYLGAHSEVSCCVCGAAISHVFWTNAGAMGGDCFASLTGNNSSRAKVRNHVQKVYWQLRYGKIGGAVFVCGNAIGLKTDWGKFVEFARADNHKLACMIGVAAAERYAAEFGVLPAFCIEAS